MGEAANEVDRACERLAGRPPVGMAFYQQAEVHRLRGEFAKAEEAYRQAGQWGRDPQPGLAMLRLAQGQVEAAAAAIRRVTDEANVRVARAQVLAAFVEIMLAAGDLGAADAAAEELARIADDLGARCCTPCPAMPPGRYSSARATPAALVVLRPALAAWRELDAPYEAARAQVLIGLALRETRRPRRRRDGAGRGAFLCSVSSGQGPIWSGSMRCRHRRGPCSNGIDQARARGAGPRGQGMTNREIAAALVISEHMARHVQHILAKLGVSSRTAAGVRIRARSGLTRRCSQNWHARFSRRWWIRAMRDLCRSSILGLMDTLR